MADRWISPTGFNDPDSKWADEAKIYDDDLATLASVSIELNDWTSYIELTVDSIDRDAIRFNAKKNANVTTIDIDIYYGSAWHDLYEGTFTDHVWIEKLFTEQSVTKARVRFFCTAGASDSDVGFYEFDFGKAATVQDPTDVLSTTVTGNGNFVLSEGNATVRGFKYGLTEVDTWSVSDSGSFSEGAFTKGLTGLTGNTTYKIRSFFTNPVGTFYSEWIEFQTAASGTVPTGTNLFIAADLSGYSFQLMKSETDDGETYTAYFVISTDLTEKQGLAFYKRILDLHLYFMSESSGTATIYVKRDNEASWQTVGSVSLTGTADIIVPHLAPDIRAKHFLFKISASNFFRFLGVLFEYLPEEMR